MENPLVSVIIPTYNRLSLLLELLDTVWGQDYGAVEVLVVDDGSTDGTEAAMGALARQDRLRYFRNGRNSGPGFSRKRGFEAASGTYIVFADDDDYYTDMGFFRRAVDILEGDREARLAAVAANARILDTRTGEWTTSALPAEGRFDRREYLEKFGGEYAKPLSTFTAVFRREKLLSGGLADSVQADDRVIYLRALLTGDIWLDGREVGVYRVHGENISRSVSPDFAVALCRETKLIYDRIRGEHLLSEPGVWWYGQIWMILRFYIQGERSDLPGLARIFAWIRRQKISLAGDLKLFKRAAGYWLWRKKGENPGP